MSNVNVEICICLESIKINFYDCTDLAMPVASYMELTRCFDLLADGARVYTQLLLENCKSLD